MLLQSIMTTCAIVLIIFIMCYFGQTVTTDCEIPADSIYNELWYRFPIKLQKSMLFIIERSQHSYVFTAFKMYRCTLRSFTTVSLVYYIKKKEQVLVKSWISERIFFLFADNEFIFSNIHAVSFNQHKIRNLKQISNLQHHQQFTTNIYYMHH